MTAGPDDTRRHLRSLPAVDIVIRELGEARAPALVTAAARAAIAGARARVLEGAPAPSLDEVVEEARSAMDGHERALLQPVINATGVLIHTNLGRVPLGDRQMDAVAAVARGYSNLEYDLDTGRRGSRHTHAARLLTALSGAEAALVVNNNAAAVLVVLASLCAGREVIISRGELVEIGGEFRIPDVLGASGAGLVEVGTTNRTHLADYERAITQQSGAILKVHPSNYRVVGFTAAVPGRDLARLAVARRLVFVHDLGSGYVGSAPELDWARREPTIAGALEDGADIVTFSGDKLLGGPQAGIVLGRAPLVEKIARHPLMRAIRPDKMTLAALEATLAVYLEGELEALPLWRMAATADLEERSRGLAAAVLGGRAGAVKVEAVALASVAGGGSLPGSELPSWGVAIVHPERSPDEIAGALRRGEPPVIGRIDDDRVLLDLRTVDPAHDGLLVTLVGAVLGRP